MQREHFGDVAVHAPICERLRNERADLAEISGLCTRTSQKKGNPAAGSLSNRGRSDTDGVPHLEDVEVAPIG
jgi:hypothetical protein